MTRFAGRFTPEDRAAGPYVYLPVEVPAGADGLQVTLEYERIGATLDLGCLGPSGWVGWSGGARTRVVLSPGASTPGYLPGLEPGVYQVVLGLHRVPRHGVGYVVDVSTGSFAPEPLPAAPPVPDRPPARSLPAPDGLRWLAGDLHAHTVHSDGALTVDELAARAAAQGLDFCAVTDHNTTSHHASLPAAGVRYGVTLLPGQEVTTDSGHANAFGDIGWVDFREPHAQWATTVAGRGGLLSVNHPVGGDCSWRHPATASLAEVWHGSWGERRDFGALAWWAARSHEPVPVGGSDWHYPGDGPTLGRPTTWVACADGSIGAVLSGLRAGRTAITAGRNGPAVLRLGDEIVVVGGEGCLLLDGDGRRTPVTSPRWTTPAGAGPYVLETWDREVAALCR